jgi:hypothetical protein
VVSKWFHSTEGLDENVYVICILQVVQTQTPRIVFGTLQRTGEQRLSVKFLHHFLSVNWHKVIFDIVE